MSDSEQPALKHKGTIVILDDEASMGRILVKMLGSLGYDAKSFSNPAEGLAALPQLHPDVLLTDVRMPEMNGMQVLQHMRREFPDVPVLMVTAFGTVESAVEAMQAGAFNYITKPFEQTALIAQITRALDHRRMLQENARLSEHFTTLSRSREIIGASSALAGVRDMIAKAAPTDSSVLITGRSGVGKELVARAIHQQSHRRNKRFVAINCPSIPTSLIESEMFGHERGAFTGADRAKMGLFELAQGGTLFLDEVAELPPEMQVKLLRVIQEREIQRVGGLRTIAVDIRLIAATNRDLGEEIRKGQFREDLYYRLNVIQLEIPSLNERPDDIPELARHFLDVIGRRMQRAHLTLTDEAMQALMQYDWPGNVRELENVIERAIVLSDGTQIDRGDLTIDLRNMELNGEGEEIAAIPAGATGDPAIDYRQARDDFERRYLQHLIQQTKGNISRAAQISGISRRNLYDKLEKVGLASEMVRKR